MSTAVLVSETAVSRWFGPRFAELHPLLQQLHLNGGVLRGWVTVQTGTGLGGWIGRRLARKFSVLPTDRPHVLTVNISHGADGLHWQRGFDHQVAVTSLFAPVGTLPDGYWLEHIKAVRLALTVDIIDGGWHWRCLKTWVYGIPIPRWLAPRTTAFKRIEQGRYRFYVGFALPGLGTVFSYSGLLEAAIDAQSSQS
jgi:hypothetical protein